MMMFMTGVAAVVALAIVIMIKVRDGFQRADLARQTEQESGFGNSFTLGSQTTVSFPTSKMTSA